MGPEERLTEQIRLLSTSPLPVALLEGPEHRFVYANDPYARLVGATRVDADERDAGALVGRSCAEVFPELARDGVMIDLLERVYRERVAIDIGEQRFDLARPDGVLEPRWFRFTYQPRLDPAGESEGILVLAVEVTEQVQSRVSVSRERERTLSIIRQAPVAMAVLRGERLVVDLANEAFARLTSSTVDDLLGHALLDRVPEAEVQELEEIVRGVRTTGERFFGSDGRLRRSSTEVQRRTYDFVIEPWRDDRDAVEGVLLIAVDVTSRTEAVRESERLRQRAEAASRTKDEFLALLGHELRNPLAPIRTALDIVRDERDGLPDDVRRSFEVIERQAAQVTRLVGDLLDVSRITRNRLTLRRSPTDLAAVLRSVAEVVEPTLHQRHQQLVLDIAAADDVVIQGDRDRLVQALTNLVNNACQYSPPSTTIEVRCAADPEQATVDVLDRGPGIPSQELERLLRPFEQGPRSIEREEGGLGLGLTLAQMFVERHAGALRLDRRPGGGTRARVTLPRSRASSPSARPSLPPALPDLSGLRVLVVDDNEDALELLTVMLRKRGLEVATAGDGRRALEEAATFQPDVALLDIGLPVMDGFQLARRIRELPGLETVSLVALTGYGQASDRERAMEAGFDSHLVKPIGAEVLLATLSAVAGDG